MPAASHPYNRRAFLRAALAGAATAATGAVLAACGGEVAPTAAPAATVRPTTAAPAAAATTAPMTAATVAPTTAAAVNPAAATTSGAAMTVPTAAATSGMTAATAGPTRAAAVGQSGQGVMTAGLIPSPRPDIGVSDAYTQYPASFKAIPNLPGKASKWTAFIISYEPPPTPKAENRYWQELEKRIGISSYEPIIAPSADYAEKFSTQIASGELPDTMFLDPQANREQFRVLLQGAFTDLTPFLTGDAIKEFPNLAKFPPQVWKNASLNKKIYGVPHLRPLNNSQVMYFRQDWAEKVGFATQKNADDVYNMFVGMSKMDPDGNGRPDTFGISSSSPRPGMAVESFRQMFRAPNEWRLNPDGSIVNMHETPEYRQAIEFARRLWEAGAYHPDAATNGTNQNKDLFFAGKIGGYTDGITGALGSNGARGKTKALNPGANVGTWFPPAFDGGKREFHTSIGYFGFTSISARAGRDREKVKELLRILDWFAAPFGSEEYGFRSFGLEGVHYEIKNGIPALNDKGRADKGPLDRFTSATRVEYWDVPGDAQYAQNFQVESLSVGADNASWGYYSPTLGMRGGELGQYEADGRVAFVTGRRPMSEWDAWVRDWRSRGGDAIKKEFQDAIKGA